MKTVTNQEDDNLQVVRTGTGEELNRILPKHGMATNPNARLLSAFGTP
jgi:hypothetical protein